MDDIWSRFASVAEHPYENIAEWKKETKGKVIGCHPMHTPEEIIHAGGVLPVAILGSKEAITQAHRYLQPSFLCLLVRSNLDLALRGKLDFLDGIVFPDICEEVRCLSDIWRTYRPAPFHYSLMLPMNLGLPLARQYLVSRFTDLKLSLERFLGQEISEQALRQSIATYNRNRSLLSRLYEIRRAKPGLFRARDIVATVAASMLMPKEEHSQILSHILKHAETAGQPLHGKVRLVLSGCLCEMPEWGILDLIEELGATIVDDDLYVGARYFATRVDESINPIEALAARHIDDVPCPTKYNPANDWGDYLISIVRGSNADGVVILMLQFCEPHGFDYPYLKDKLSAANVPHLLLTTDHSGASGQIRTRLQAFIELLDRGGQFGSQD